MTPANNAAADTQHSPVRRRRVHKTKAVPNTIRLNQDGEWMASAELQTCLLSLLSTESATVLDLGGLTHVDPASFQVLVSAARAGLLASGKVCLANLSDPVRRCLQYAGAEVLLTGAESR